MAEFFGSKKVTMEFTPEEYELLKKEALKQGMSVEEVLKKTFKDKASGQDLDPFKFKLAKDKLLAKNDKTLKKLADL